MRKEIIPYPEIMKTLSNKKPIFCKISDRTVFKIRWDCIVNGELRKQFAIKYNLNHKYVGGLVTFKQRNKDKQIEYFSRICFLSYCKYYNMTPSNFNYGLWKIDGYFKYYVNDQLGNYKVQKIIKKVNELFEEGF